MRLLPAVAAGAVFIGCASSNTITEPVVYSQSEAADSVRVRVGSTIVVDGIRVRFDEVTSDSRCAIDVVCIWAGDAVARFSVQPDCECRVAALGLELHTTLEPRSGEAYGYRVSLLALSPAPRSDRPPRRDDYAAWLRLVKLS